MGRFSILVSALAIITVGCSDKSSSTPPLTPENKAQLQRSVTQEYQLNRSLQTTSGELNDKENQSDISDLLNMLKPCEVISDGKYGETGGWSSVSLTGSRCPVGYTNRTEIAGKIIDGGFTPISSKSKLRYQSTNSDFLNQIDITDYSSETIASFDFGGSTEVVFLKTTMQLNSQSIGQVSGYQAMSMQALNQTDMKAKWTYNLKFPTFVVNARAEAVMSEWDKEEPTVKSMKFWINGAAVSAEEFAQYFPGGTTTKSSQFKVSGFHKFVKAAF